MVTLQVDRAHLLVALDALASRRDAYARTAAWYRGEADDDFLIEEVRDEEEALAIAAHFEAAREALAAAL